MKELAGVGVALATPLHKDYSVDFTSLEKLINQTIDGNVDYLVVQGTTGESPVFSWKEKLEILDLVIEKNKGRKPIVFGLGGNNTFDLIEKSKDLKNRKIDAILSVNPYYNKPSQKGIIRHFEMLANAYPHPIILYNVPSRTASNMKAETTLALAHHPNIVGMKEASGDLDQCKQIADNKPDEFLLLCGDDALTLELIKLGADGVISVIANLLPMKFSLMVHYALQGNLKQALELDKALKTAYHLSGKEGNPSSLKAGLEVAGICTRTVKPPLFDGSDELVVAWTEYLKA